MRALGMIEEVVVEMSVSQALCLQAELAALSLNGGTHLEILLKELRLLMSRAA